MVRANIVARAVLAGHSGAPRRSPRGEGAASADSISPAAAEYEFRARASHGRPGMTVSGVTR
jgi:hypothetical protein